MELVPRTPDILSRRQEWELERERRDQALRMSKQEHRMAVSQHLEKRRIQANAHTTNALLNAGHILVKGEMERVKERHQLLSRVRNPDVLASLQELVEVADMGAKNAVYEYYND